MSQHPITLLDVFRIVPAEIQVFFTLSDFLSVERMCKGIKLNIPLVDLDFHASLRLLNFLRDHPKLEDLIKTRLKRTMLEIYIEFSYLEVLSEIPLEHLYHLNTVKILVDNCKDADAEKPFLEIIDKLRVNGGVSIVWKGINIPTDLKLLNSFNKFEEVFMLRENRDVTKRVFLESHFEEIKILNIFSDSLTDEYMDLIQRKLKSLGDSQSRPRVNILFHNEFFNAQSKEDLRRFETLMLMADGVAVEFNYEQFLQHTVSFFSMHSELAVKFWEKVYSVNIGKFSQSNLQKFQSLLDLTKSGLKKLHVEGEIWMNFSSFRNLSHVTLIGRLPENFLPSETMKSLSLTDLTSFDFAAIERYTRLESLGVVVSKTSVVSSINMRKTFRCLTHLNISAQTEIHLSSLPASIFQLDLATVGVHRNPSGNPAITAVIHSPQIIIRSTDYQGLDFGDCVDRANFMVLDQSKPVLSPTKLYPFRSLLVGDCLGVKWTELIIPRRFPKLQRLKIPNEEPLSKYEEQLFLKLLQVNPNLSFLTFFTEECDLSEKFRTLCPDLRVRKYGVRMEVERVR
jgi:hypothetical protein